MEWTVYGVFGGGYVDLKVYGLMRDLWMVKVVGCNRL